MGPPPLRRPQRRSLPPLGHLMPRGAGRRIPHNAVAVGLRLVNRSVNKAHRATQGAWGLPAAYLR